MCYSVTTVVDDDFCLGEKQLKHRIKELTRYRKHGITRLEGKYNVFSLLLYAMSHCYTDCLDCEKVKRKSQVMLSCYFVYHDVMFV